MTDVQWVPIPKAVYANDDDATEFGADLVKISSFMRDAQAVPEESLQTLDQLDRQRPSVLPDPRLFCIDEVFWYIDQPQRWHRHAEWHSGSGAWAAVGKHVRYQPALVRLADEYLLHAFGMGSDQSLPPFFAVHIRRGGGFRSDSLTSPFSLPSRDDEMPFSCSADDAFAQSRLSAPRPSSDNDRALCACGMGSPAKYQRAPEYRHSAHNLHDRRAGSRMAVSRGDRLSLLPPFRDGHVLAHRALTSGLHCCHMAGTLSTTMPRGQARGSGTGELQYERHDRQGVSRTTDCR